MKQKRLIIIPILALTFLVSCNNGGDTPTPPGPEPDPSITYTVTFDSKEGSYTPDSQTIEAGKSATEPTEPIKQDFTFGGWYTDEATKYKYDFSRPVVTDLTLYAKWEDAHKLVSVTFDAKDGLFGGTSRYLGLSVPIGTKVCSAIKMIKDSEPISDGKVFACYSYKDNVDTIIDYRDTVNSDITLEANYLPANKSPYNDLDEFEWNFIRQVAVTKNDISKVFALGATKTVDLYEQPHKVRIIGYNHDILTKNTETEEDIYAGLTFEFANLITKEDGTSLKTFWNEKSINKSDKTNKFINSTFYDLLNGEDGSGASGIFSELPKELKDVTQLVTKQVGQGGETEAEQRELVPYNTKFFPLACAEIQRESHDRAPAGEGTIYQYYDKTHTETLRTKAPVGGSMEYYWLRSPYCSNYDLYAEAWYVNGISLLWGRSVCKTTQIYEGIGIAPAFCI